MLDGWPIVAEGESDHRFFQIPDNLQSGTLNERSFAPARKGLKNL